jgi:magnesium transporter
MPMTGQLKTAQTPNGGKDFQTLYFSQMLKRRICAGKIKDKIGKLSDLVFRLAEPYPEAVGIYLEHGWGKPTEFIPWEKVLRVDDDAIFVQPPEGGQYPPFVDQPGWILLNDHLMGKTILDMDGRRIEVVNDVHLLESKGRMIIVHVDISFNGFLREWGLGWFHLIKDQLISWRYVQPLSLEDVAAKKDIVSLSVTRKQIKELPSEDLADALEQLSGQEQTAVFSALDTEKAAETLLEAEPRARRQIIANLRMERARNILLEMSVPQLADLFSVLPHDDRVEMMGLLPPEQAERISSILSGRESTARALMSSDYVTVPKEARVGDVLKAIRGSGRPHESISYVYVVSPENVVLGVADLRELVLTPDEKPIGEVMVSPVVAAEEDDLHDDMSEMFAKYHFRMIPVVDPQDHMLGVVHYNDIMKGLVTRARA